MEMRRRRMDESVPSASASEPACMPSAAAAVVAAGEPACMPSAATAVVAAGDAAGDAAAEIKSEEASKDLAVIGQELVPVTGGAKGSGDSQKEELSEPDVKEGPFQTPVEKRKPVSPAETLQFQNTPWVDPNEESGNAKGLLDSGATHPLRARRKGEKISHLPSVDVTLAGNQQVSMRLSPTGVIISEEQSETTNGLEIVHPQLGLLDVKLQDGCPVVPYNVALQLIQEIEDIAKLALKSLQRSDDLEVQWIRRLVHEHPAFSSLPSSLKEALIEQPAKDVVPMASRRIRKLWKQHGAITNLFSGEDAGYTLKRAFHEIGGDRRLLWEMDVLRGTRCSCASLSTAGQGLGWRTTLSYQISHEIPGQNMPRPSGPGMEENMAFLV